MPKNKDAAILDIGSLKLTVLAGDYGVNRIFNIKGKGEALYGGFSDDEFLEPEKLLKAVKKAVTEAEENMKSRIKKLYIGVPGEFCTTVCKEASITFKNRRKVTDIDVEELFLSGQVKSGSYTLINRVPVYYNLDDNKKALSPVGLPSLKLGGLLSFNFAENKFINTFKNILENLNIYEYEFVSSVLAEAGLLFEDKEKQVLFADIGYLTSSVALCQGNGLLFLKSFSLGGAHISSDLMECLHISFPLAQKLKEDLKLNFEVDSEEIYKVTTKTETCDVSMQTANEIAVARIELIGKMIKRCIKESSLEIPSYYPLYITGGGISYIRGATDILSALLDRNVEIVAPQAPRLNKPQLSSSVGVLNFALGLAEKEKKGFFAKLFK